MTNHERRSTSVPTEEALPDGTTLDYLVNGHNHCPSRFQPFGFAGGDPVNYYDPNGRNIRYAPLSKISFYCKCLIYEMDIQRRGSIYIIDL